jgi:hypothetical protein
VAAVALFQAREASIKEEGPGKRMLRIVTAVLLLRCLPAWGADVSNAGADVAGIVQRSAQANDRDWAAAPGFSYRECDKTEHGTRTYQVLMVAGSPYRKLIAINGEPLDPALRTHEEHELTRTMAQRRNETNSQRDARVAVYQNGRRRDHLLISQLVSAFNFELLGQQQVGPHQVYVLQATPRPGYIPPNRDTKVLTGMQGKLWIDAKTYQWVKVEAQVIRPVWIEGFLAKVTTGTRFALDYAPVTDDIWLPARFTMQSRAKILGLFSRHGEADESFSDYQKESAP